jgi:hypothetical protein
MGTPGGSTPGDGVGANNHSPLLSRRVAEAHLAKRKKAAIEEMSRHCWLNPESRIVFSGAKRRKNFPSPFAGEGGPKGRKRGSSLKKSK